MEQFQVTNNLAESRYEVHVGGEVATLTYGKKGLQTIFFETSVPPALEGQGIGSALARRALADTLQEKHWQIPLCPFVRGYAIQHPDYQDNPLYYRLLAQQPEAVQELLLLARSMVVDVVPEPVIEVAMIGEQMVGYAEKGGKFTDNLCWFTVLPDGEGLALYFNEEIDLSYREDLPGDFVPIRSAEDLKSPALRSLLLAAWEAVE